jgi:hypothetical protein
MRLALRVISVLAVVWVTLEIATYVYRRSHSESIASGMIQELCHEQGYDPKKLSGPIEGHDGNCSYSWTYKDATHNLELLVFFNRFYEPKIAKWDYGRKD